MKTNAYFMSVVWRDNEGWDTTFSSGVLETKKGPTAAHKELLHTLEDSTNTWAKNLRPQVLAFNLV